MSLLDGNWSGGKSWVLNDLLSSLVELAVSTSLRVVVVWAWTILLLGLAVTPESELDDCRNEEEDTDKMLEDIFIISSGKTYAATMATAKQAVFMRQAVPKLGKEPVVAELTSPEPIGVLTFPLQLFAPLLVSTATKMKQPTKARSRRIARKAKKLSPPTQHTNKMANAVYMTAAPLIPSMAL